MCGICGVLRLQPPGPVDREALTRMRDAMAHRGPDEHGVFVADDVGLGHRRLSIIDLSSGTQPMASADGSVWISYNGEIYNFQTLRSLLESRGFGFRTKSDTEVILAAYQAFGEGCLDHLRGMFAFALWDAEKRQLLLARDRLGIKPLYYTVQGGALLFASEIKAILQWPGVRRAVDRVALRDYLRHRYVPGPRTLFEGIHKLQPGHVLRARNGNVEIRRYWDLPLDGETHDPERAERELRERIEDCVESHLVSDVALGVFLSGGLDSTVVTGVMSELLAGPAESFSVGYDGNADSDERPFAQLAATRFGTVHRALALDPRGFWAVLPMLVWHLDEPVADPAAVPLYFLSKFARRFVTVLLSGEGADEILAGYAIYRKMLWLERLHPLSPLARPLGAMARDARRRRYLEWAGLPLERRYRGVSSVFSVSDADRLLGHGGDPEDEADSVARYFEPTRRLDPLRRMLYFDTKVWLPDDLLVKADKTTMAASIELRVPFLDHTLVEWAWRLPSRLKLRGRTGKYLLRQATRDLVPPPILERPKKGFTIPLADWFRGGLAGSVRALVTTSGAAELLNRAEVEALIARQERGGEDLSQELFTLATFALWHRLFIDPRVVEAPASPASEAPPHA
jgi:asparagine synthase (glutamine-hydrolysing)